MDLEKTSIILKKINRLHDLINAIGEASSTETDLLKAYVIDLYEAVAMSDIAEVNDLDKEEMEKKLKKQKKVEKKIKKKIHKKEVAKIEDDIEEEEEEDDDDIVEEIEKEVKEALKEIEAEETIAQEEVKATPKPKKVKAKVGYSNELIELFDLHESAELSDKLANAPIKDLTKAMGINERIFTVNELFGGNQGEMTNILSAINGLDNFAEAKSVLMDSVAQKYNWTEGSKLKKAKNFIKLVKRRFK